MTKTIQHLPLRAAQPIGGRLDEVAHERYGFLPFRAWDHPSFVPRSGLLPADTGRGYH